MYKKQRGVRYMLKIRITYSREDEKELERALKKIEKEFNVLSKSRAYRGRGESKYNNVYIDVENK